MEFPIDVLTAIWLGIPLWAWLGFTGFIVGLLALDLGVFHRDSHEVGFAESLRMAGFYVTIAIAFGAAVWCLFERTRRRCRRFVFFQFPIARRTFMNADRLR